MATFIDLLDGFVFDPLSEAVSQNFLHYIAQSSKPYTIFANTPDRWIIQANFGGIGLGFGYVGFFPAPGATFLPAPTSSKVPPLGVVGAIAVYDSAGQVIATFTNLAVLGFDAEDYIANPALLVSGDDDLLGSALADVVHVGVGDDYMDGSGGNDQMYGDAGDDFLYGNTGNDTLLGGEGDDLLEGGAGDDVIEGGDGQDTTSFVTAASAVSVVLAWGGAQDTLGGGLDSFSSIENLFGSLFNDTLVGSALDNSIAGADGDDWIVGLEGNDILEGGPGVNVLLGGAGVDLASYESAISGLWVDMAAGVYSAAGVWDVFFESIEGVLGGSGNDSIFGNGLDNTLRGGGGDDALIGGVGNDRLEGGTGSDWIVGGEGNDRLIGGEGVDVLTGGAGADTFDLGTAAGWDVAFDFNTAEDRLSLGGLSWLGFLTIDADGDGQADDTLLGYAGGNFVALNAAGLSLAQWNALVDVPAGAASGKEMMADAEIAPLAAWVAPMSGVEPGLSGVMLDTSDIQPPEASGWGMIG